MKDGWDCAVKNQEKRRKFRNRDEKIRTDFKKYGKMLTKSELQKNCKKSIVSGVFLGIGTLFCIGSIVQAFFIKIGLSENQIYYYNSFTYAMQVVVMFIMIFVSDKIKKVKLVYEIVSLSFIPLFVVFIIGSFCESVDGWFLYLLYGVSALAYIGYGIRNILSYILPYKIFDMNEYGKMLGLSGGLGGACTLGVSLFHSFIISKFDYNTAMVCFFIGATVCSILGTSVSATLKVSDDAQTKKPENRFSELLKNKTVYFLMLPNFLRGIATGTVGVITVIATTKGILETQSASYVNIITQFGLFFGSIAFAFSCKKIKARKLLLLGTAVFCGVIPFVVSSTHLATFLILYSIVYFFLTIVDTAIPVLVTEIIPENQIGGYTSIRMMIFTAGTSVAGMIIPVISSSFGYSGVMVLAAVCELICGLTYYVIALVKNRNKTINTSLE